MEKHFTLSVTNDIFTYQRDEEKIAAEEKLDGIYVIRTSLAPNKLDTSSVIESYKNLAAVERDFRSIKTDDLDLRPIRHYRTNRVERVVDLLAGDANARDRLYIRMVFDTVSAALLAAQGTGAAAEDVVATARRASIALTSPAADSESHDDVGTTSHDPGTPGRRRGWRRRSPSGPLPAPIPDHPGTAGMGGQRCQGLIEHGDVVRRGVRPGVARTQQRGHRLPGAPVAVIGIGQQGMGPRPAFIL
jgi:hypothetical protein